MNKGNRYNPPEKSPEIRLASISAYEGVVLDMEPAEKPEAKTFSPVKVEAYRADSWDLGNFEVDLYIDENNYHSLDMQDLTNPNDKYLSEGN